VAAGNLNPFGVGTVIGLPGIFILIAWMIALVECPDSIIVTFRGGLFAITTLSSVLYLVVLWFGLVILPEKTTHWGIGIILFFVHGLQYLLFPFGVSMAVVSAWVSDKPPAE
jgi:hypothetical protein